MLAGVPVVVVGVFTVVVLFSVAVVTVRVALLEPPKEDNAVAGAAGSTSVVISARLTALATRVKTFCGRRICLNFFLMLKSGIFRYGDEVGCSVSTTINLTLTSLISTGQLNKLHSFGGSLPLETVQYSCTFSVV